MVAAVKAATRVHATRRLFQVRAQHYGRWWGLTVPDAPGAVSQVRSLDQAENYIREAIAFVTDTAPDSFDVEVRADLQDLTDELHRVRQAIAAAEAAQREAGEMSRRVVAKLKARGLTGKDAATVMKISPQRVSQLLRSTRERV
jgi:DNA-directed RNA polymerase specialized sigma subunit